MRRGTVTTGAEQEKAKNNDKQGTASINCQSNGYHHG